MNLYLDIETIPTQNPAHIEYLRGKLKPPGNIKKEESIAAWWEEKSEEALDELYRKTALNGAFGEIICICFAADNGKVQKLYRTLEEPERDLLITFYEYMEELVVNPRKPTPVYVGNRVGAFDLKFLHQRSIVHGVEPNIDLLATAADWHGCIYDLSFQWNGRNGFVSLDELATALNIKSPKENMDGSMVWDYVKEGRIKEVADYCAEDVRASRKIYKRFHYTTKVSTQVTEPFDDEALPI